MPGRPSEVLRHAERYLARHGTESPRKTAEVLLARVLGTDRAGLYARSEGLSSSEAQAFGRALCRRCTGTPLQHLTGTQAFRYLELQVGPGVFVPRPETEVVVDAVLEAMEGLDRPVVVDVGTGTGAIALSVKRERPHAVVHATDLSPEAVRLARRNARRLGLDVAVHDGYLMEPLPAEVRGRVAVLASNPPYVDRDAYQDLPPEVLADPQLALVGGTHVHRRLAREAPTWLAPRGALVMEIGADQGAEVAALLRKRFSDVRVLPDLAGRDRVATGRLAPRRAPGDGDG